MHNKELIFWIWFSEAMGPANPDSIRILKHYENPYEIFRCEEYEVAYFEGLSPTVQERLLNKDLLSSSKILEDCEKYQIEVLTYKDERYPNILREIQTPPILLYYQGTLPDWNRHLTLGVVGTRNITAYGLHFAYKIAYEIASTDSVIVSGMASGVDGVAAAAAIAANGVTVAVLGSGLDIIYPYHHKRLHDAILKKGALVSEYPPGAPIKPYNFPTRNRIISGLSRATFVVEAGIGSGSLITARSALSHGREVYALPSNIGRDGAEGTNELLREGAMMISKTEDILERHQYVYAPTLRSERLMKAKKQSQVDLSFLSNMKVAVFDPADRKKNGPPFVSLESIEYFEKTVLAHWDEMTTGLLSPSKVEKASSLKNGETISANASAKKTKAETPTFIEEKQASPAAPSPKSSAHPATRQEPKADPPKLTTPLESLSPIQVAILEMIPEDRAIAADAFGALEFPYGDIIAALTMLEIMGLVQKLPGALYTKI